MAVVLLVQSAAGQPLPRRIEAPGPFPYGLARAANKLWCVDFETSALYRIALPEGRVRRVAKLPVRSPNGLCFARSKLWVVAESAIHQVDPCTGSCRRRLALDSPAPTGLASDGCHFFVADRQSHVITTIDAVDGKVVRRFPTTGRAPRGMTFHDGALWLVDSADRAVYRLHPTSGSVEAAFVSPDGQARGVEWVDGRWWFSMRQTHSLQPTRAEPLGPEVPGNAMRSNPLRVRITFIDKVENRSPKAIRRVVFCLAVPPETPRQQIESLHFEPEPDEYRTDRFGQKIAVFRFPKLPPNRTAQVRWTAVARLWAIRYTPDPHRLGPLAEVPRNVARLFTEDACVLGLDSPGIQEAAREAAAGTRDPLELSGRIRDYVMQRVRYVRDGRWDPAATVLERGQGSCSEYSYAFTALARCNGLPVRFVGATAYRPAEGDSPAADSDSPTAKTASAASRYEDRVFHRWVEVYLPPYGWLPVDVNRDDRPSPPFPRRYFLALPERLFVISKTGWDSGRNLGADYHSHRTWKRGKNSKRECRVKTHRVALWQPLPDSPPRCDAAPARGRKSYK